MLKRCLPYPSLIKIDVEGVEIECLLWGIGIIKECHPLLIIEFHNEKLLGKGYSLLTSLNYKFFTQKGLIDYQFKQNIKRFHQSVFCYHFR